jgi:hypothetical protein
VENLMKKGKYIRTEEIKQKYREAHLGKHPSEETKQKIRESHSGAKHPMYGKHLSEEHKKKLREARKKQIGVNAPGYGKHPTEVTKQKIREATLGRKNPYYGTNNPRWKGENVSYSVLHKWIRRYKPSQSQCSMCGEIKPLELANVSHKYKRDIRDFIWLCRKCHKWYDRNT